MKYKYTRNIISQGIENVISDLRHLDPMNLSPNDFHLEIQSTIRDLEVVIHLMMEKKDKL